MTTKSSAESEAQRALQAMREKAGTHLYMRAAAEIEEALPPWVKERIVRMNSDDIRALMIMAWLRGHSARGEMLS